MTRKWTFRLLIACIGLTLFAAPGLATPIVSTFDTDIDGWRMRHFNSGGDLGYDPLYDSVGGNIYAGGVSGMDTGHGAPAKFLGDRSAFYGQHVSYDVYLSGGTPPYPTGYYAVALTGFYHSEATTIMAKAGSLSPGWNHLSFALTEAAWFLGGYSVSREVIDSILSNLAGLQLQGRWIFLGGTEEHHIDNVQFGDTNPVPLPGALVLLASGLAGLAVFRRRA